MSYEEDISIPDPSDALTAGYVEPEPEQFSENTKTLIKRRSRLQSAWEAFCYVTRLSRAAHIVSVRISDRLTSVTLLIAAILAVLSIVLQPLFHLRLPLFLLCDFLVGAMIVLYLLNRFGILLIFPERHALLSWQMIVVSYVMGMFVMFNIGLIIAITLLNSRLFKLL